MVQHLATAGNTAPPADPGRAPDAPQPYLTIREAATRLSTTPAALRARCRRSARGDGRSTVPLGGRIVAVKLGGSWRVRFPDPRDDGNEAEPTMPANSEPERLGGQTVPPKRWTVEALRPTGNLSLLGLTHEGLAGALERNAHEVQELTSDAGELGAIRLFGSWFVRLCGDSPKPEVK